ncbi:MULTISPECIES: fatty acid cis/trans isomerase [unclassified Colwellia]|uniref:fatty acid cis/trans isomerase n=1 Tax=unclassified Colwellia TaxID=196834 RepID=UPI0015F4D6FE|nr:MULTISPECIES: fatty acid cis/trans isomerase [unclassified Colwellia]MBA6256197.1 fatty acid cis/trans isomerase [Colwellia sp. MB3u-28]MBA6260081.1 fatty acid cis/trans isomerase [Colwellia sp. MB3u-41]MBA6301847.1 fatty acid cis/trans isomerase [Colwellia sp. MB02u-14]
MIGFDVYTEDTLNVAKGAIGTYPKAFCNINPQEVAVENMKKSDNFDLKTRYAIRQTNKDFWIFSDKLHR